MTVIEILKKKFKFKKFVKENQFSESMLFFSFFNYKLPIIHCWIAFKIQVCVRCFNAVIIFFKQRKEGPKRLYHKIWEKGLITSNKKKRKKLFESFVCSVKKSHLMLVERKHSVKGRGGWGGGWGEREVVA